ncbi:MAG: nitrogen regulation protein NR(II), partial [Rhodanobacteraceae bacterium]
IQLAGNAEFLSALKRTADTHETITLRESVLQVGPSRDRHAITVDCTLSALVESGRTAELLVELAALDRHLHITRETSLGDQQHLNRSFARQLAHEIKNPLGSIRGAAQLLERKLTERELSEYTRLIVSETDRLTSLVDALLGPWRPGERQPCNLHEIVEHVVHLTRTAGAGLEILRDYDPSLPELYLNRDQMVQALLNLAKNAREATHSAGRLVFRTRALRQYTLNGRRYRLAACIEIEDDGPGIPAPVQPYLFAPLVSRKSQGAGLGLSIAQELVSRNGGLIEYQTTPGRTVFCVVLPMETEHESARA